MLREQDTRFRIIKTLVDARKPLSLSAIAKKLRMVPQKVDYHLSFLTDTGLVIKDGYTYFAQPVLIDEELKSFCAEKMAEIIEAFSKQDSAVVVVNGQDPEDVILNNLYVMIHMIMP